jgi:hypothetical protein
MTGTWTIATHKWSTELLRCPVGAFAMAIQGCVAARVLIAAIIGAITLTNHRLTPAMTHANLVLTNECLLAVILSAPVAGLGLATDKNKILAVIALVLVLPEIVILAIFQGHS